MALLTCPDCRGKVSDLAPACPHCGRPMAAKAVSDQLPKREGDAKCRHCGRMVTPVVTSVGGGSCSFGRREKWTCPSCQRTMHRSGCFVATAAYGDEDFIEVHFLRQFRDRYLLRSRSGRVLVWVYYAYGPYAAAFVQRSSALSAFTRGALDIVVSVIERLTPVSRESCAKELRRQLGEQANDRPAI